MVVMDKGSSVAPPVAWERDYIYGGHSFHPRRHDEVENQPQEGEHREDQHECHEEKRNLSESQDKG